MRFRDRIRTHLMKQLQLHHLLVSDSAFLAEEGLLVTGSCAHQDPILVCFSWSLLETCKQQHHCAPCWPKPTMAQRFWRPSAVPIRACVRLSCSRRRMMMLIDRWMAMVDCLRCIFSTKKHAQSCWHFTTKSKSFSTDNNR